MPSLENPSLENTCSCQVLKDDIATSQALSKPLKLWNASANKDKADLLLIPGCHASIRHVQRHEVVSNSAWINAWSAKSVGDFGFGERAEVVIEGGL